MKKDTKRFSTIKFFALLKHVEKIPHPHNCVKKEEIYTG